MKPGSARARSTPVLGRDALRAIDARCVARYGLPTLCLMEQAGAAVAEQALTMLRRMGARDAIIVCGRGNNGGDGLVAARLLHNAGIRVRLALAAPARAFAGDAAVHLRVTRLMRLRTSTGASALAWLDPARLRAPALVIDALFGTGLDRPITGLPARLIAAMNSARAAGRVRVLAVDVPSGLDADTGRGWGPPESPCVRADATVTLVALKPGLATPWGRRLAGRVRVADIGVPDALVRQFGKSRRAKRRTRG